MDSNTITLKIADRKSNLGKYCSIKDLFHIKGLLTTGGCYPMKEHVSLFDSDVYSSIKNRWECLYKDNLDEMGVGQEGYSSLFNSVTYRGLDLGGSSTGSALNVYLDRVNFAIGSDTGGSIRDVVYSLNGLIGFKPTWGLISRWGMIPHSNPLDTVSIISKDRGEILRVFVANLLSSKRDDSVSGRKLVWKKPVKVRRNACFIINEKVIFKGFSWRVRGLNCVEINRCYNFWSSIYLYSNLQRFFNKSFTSPEANDWIFRPVDEGYIPRFSVSIKRRYFMGWSYLRSDRFNEIRERMSYLKSYYSRWLEILLTKGRVLTRVRDTRGRNWGLVLSNFLGGPAIAIGNLNIMERRYYDLSLIRKWRI